jgi:rhodanese-related sulfurtransferase
MKKADLLHACAEFIEDIPENLNYMTPSELRIILQKSPQSIFVLDVRNCEAYNESHIEGAKNIGIDDLFHDEQIKELPTNKPIVVCCGIGHVASQILTLLQLLGYNAVGLKYGMGVSTVAGEVQKGWVELGYPVHSTATTHGSP